MVHNQKRDFFDKLDGPLSALACNCFQLSCLIPGRESYCIYESSADTSNWMGQLVASLSPTSTMTLRDMVLPGSHDSASGTIGPFKPFSAAGRTQNYSAGQQLQAGIRYLDLRVASSAKGGDILSIWHGCLEGGNFEEVLQDIATFVQDHPKEFIVLELVPEFGKKFGTDQRRRCLERAHELLGGDRTIIPGDQLREIVSTKPYAHVADLPQSVAVLLHDRFFEGDGIGMTDAEVTAKFGFVKGGKFLKNPWNNTRDITELLAKNLKTVEDLATVRDRFVSNQFLVTPGVGNANDVINALMGKNSLRPVSHACRLYAPNVMDRFLCQQADKSWNIVALDFVDLCPDITDFMIALNWKNSVTMKVSLAAICVDGANQDVTSTVQANMFRDAVVFLVDPETDVASGSSNFNLAVAYSLTHRNDSKKAVQHFVTTVDVSCDSPVIISPYCCNKTSQTVEITADNGVTGVAFRGQVFPTKAQVADANGSAVFEYNIDGAKCDFHVV